MSNNIIAIFACHTTCMKKYVTTLSNLYNIYSFIDNFIIIDSNQEKLSNNLIEDLKNDPKFYKSFLINNDIYYDFGKWIHVLTNEKLTQFKHILFINDSVLLTRQVSKFFLYFKDLKQDINLFAYNDSSQLEVYHYQSYLFIIKQIISNKFIDFFNSKKEFIKNEKTLIEQLELNLLKIDSKHDAYLKIANNFNKHKNIFWENEELYEKLINEQVFHLFKLKKINDHFKHYQYEIRHYLPLFDRNYYSSKYPDLSKVLNLKKHYLEYGYNEGRSSNPHGFKIIPDYCTKYLNELLVNSFFNLPKEFDIYYYKKNKNVENLTNIECLRHFFDYGNDDNTMFSIKKDDIFNWNKQKNEFYCKQIQNLYHHIISLPDDFVLFEYMQLNKNNDALLGKGILEIIYNFYHNKEKYYTFQKISEQFSIDHFRKLFPSLSSSPEYDILIFFYEHFKEKEIMKHLPLNFNSTIYQNLHDDLTYLENDELLKDHYRFIGFFEKREYIMADFDPEAYRDQYTNLNNLSDSECLHHYVTNGFKEGKIYKLPEGFNVTSYRCYYLDELKDFTDKKCTEHYFSIGHKEQRKYKIPDTFHLENYKKLHKDVSNFSDEECLKHYILIGINENRICGIPSDFHPDEYKIIFPNLGNKTNEEITTFFLEEGYRLNPEYKIEKDFDTEFYKSLYSDLSDLSKYELMFHYYNHGKKEGRIYKVPENIRLDLFREFNESYKNFTDFQLIQLLMNNNVVKKKMNDLPKNFNIDIYRALNQDLKNLSNDALEEHYKLFGCHEKRNYEKPINFNYQDYQKIYKDVQKLNENDAMIHYLTIGKEQNRISEFPKDFDYDFYRRIYHPKKEISNEMIKNEFMEEYYREKRIYKIPEDFIPQIYIKLNKDLSSLNLQDAVTHFIEFGFHENRKYNIEFLDEKEIDKEDLPYDFNPDNYRKYNPDLHYYNDNNYLINHYLNTGKKENRIYKLPEKFSIENYKKFNKDLRSLSDEKVMEHFINYGLSEKRIYSIPSHFNHKFYRSIYFSGSNMSNEELEQYFQDEGYSNGHFCNIPEDFNVYFYRRLNEDLNDLNDEELLYHFIHLGIKEKRPYF